MLFRTAVEVEDMLKYIGKYGDKAFYASRKVNMFTDLPLYDHLEKWYEILNNVTITLKYIRDKHLTEDQMYEKEQQINNQLKELQQNIDSGEEPTEYYVQMLKTNELIKATYRWYRNSYNYIIGEDELNEVGLI
jgi:hypothetical protein